MHWITHSWVAYNDKHDLDNAANDIRPDIGNMRAMHLYPIHTTVTSIAHYLTGAMEAGWDPASLHFSIFLRFQQLSV